MMIFLMATLGLLSQDAVAGATSDTMAIPRQCIVKQIDTSMRAELSSGLLRSLDGVKPSLSEKEKEDRALASVTEIVFRCAELYSWTNAQATAAMQWIIANEALPTLHARAGAIKLDFDAIRRVVAAMPVADKEIFFKTKSVTNDISMRLLRFMAKERIRIPGTDEEVNTFGGIVALLLMTEQAALKFGAR